MKFADVETSSDDYARRFSGSVGEWFLEVQQEIALKFLRVFADCRSVLEVGGGHGQLAFPFVDHGYKVTVVGSSDQCSQRVKKLLDKNFATFVVADLLSLPFESQSFDSVTCIRLLTHCDSWSSLIGELCRVSRAQVVVDYPPAKSSNYFYKFLFRFKHGAEGDTRPFTIFKDEEIINAFEHHGFVLQKKCPQFFLPMVLYRKLKSRKIAQFIEWCFRRIGLTDGFGSPTMALFIRKNPL